MRSIGQRNLLRRANDSLGGWEGGGGCGGWDEGSWVAIKDDGDGEEMSYPFCCSWNCLSCAAFRNRGGKKITIREENPNDWKHKTHKQKKRKAQKRFREIVGIDSL